MFSPAKFSVAALASLGVAAFAANSLADQSKIENEKIDYDGFAELVDDVSAIREKRLIDLETFLKFAADEDTLVLDARSAEAFAAGHIDGAVNLSFSDFTQEKLDKLIGDKSKRILIYCNNNFADDEEPVPLKRVELALNIPTFVNLHGYGFTNVYELEESVFMDDPRIDFVQPE
ncbi:MAG: rhodanese-like domain-containing protein [Marinicaulis sp.]|nr:rhodanese-like domain-containing protein [Marinicaulis sp.]NNL87463.1 rhodanese-like domain-containing protein [Marinicaulis sp.]